MAEFIYSKWRQGNIGKRHHLVAHSISIKLTAHRTLHPSISHKNPPCRDCCTQACEPCRSKMESCRHLIPSKEHHSYEGRLHKESHYTLDSQRSSEDVANKPRIVAPVSTKLKFKNDTCSHTHGKVDSKETLPKLSSIFPKTFASAIIAGLHNTHYQRQT